jgi:hypothetical protein
MSVHRGRPKANGRQAKRRDEERSPHEVIVNTEVMHLKTEGDCRYGGMSLPQDGFDAACQAIIGSQFEQPSFKSVVRPNPELMRRLVNLQKSVCLIAKTSPELFELPEVVRAFEQNSIHLMVRCLTEGTISTMSSGAQRHEAIVKRFEEFLEANPNTPLYLTENLRGCWRGRTHNACCLRRSSWYGADPLPRIAKNASRPPCAIAGR